MVLPVPNPTKSFWIEAAESHLRNCRSTETLPAEADVVVIGSGYSGASTAYWLHKFTANSPRQPKVVMLEARDVCSCATGRNGGQLRPHAYSRYTPWSARFGAQGAINLIRHEMAHLPAFRALAAEENITEEICLKFGETFDAAMSDEAWTRLTDALTKMTEDHGEDNDTVKQCRLIKDPKEAEEFTQMKGCVGAVVHPAGQVWPYKFVHALLRILLGKGNLNLQAHTPATSVSERGADGMFTVTTPRRQVRAKAVVHATNRWASHLLPEYNKLICGIRITLAALDAPQGFLKHTGSQHWDGVVNNYFLQLPPPFNAVILGGARQVLVHQPLATHANDEEDKQFEGVKDFFERWLPEDVAGWPEKTASLAREADEGGYWSGVESSSTDGFPFVGPVPGRDGNFMAAGFHGHGMPRILLSTAHIAPLVLDSIGFEHTPPSLVSEFPPLPEPFLVTAERVQALQKVDLEAEKEKYVKVCEESAAKPFCREERFLPESWK